MKIVIGGGFYDKSCKATLILICIDPIHPLINLGVQIELNDFLKNCSTYEKKGRGVGESLNDIKQRSHYDLQMFEIFFFDVKGKVVPVLKLPRHAYVSSA
jgi:hypothetical protein